MESTSEILTVKKESMTLHILLYQHNTSKIRKPKVTRLYYQALTTLKLEKPVKKYSRLRGLTTCIIN